MSAVPTDSDAAAPIGALPNIPWEDRPAGQRRAVWRYSRNPIIPRDLSPTLQQHLQQRRRAVRGRVRRRLPLRRHAAARCTSTPAAATTASTGRSTPQPIEFARRTARAARSRSSFEYAYDPRVTWLEDRYYVTWCNGYHGPTIGIGYTHDFVTFHQLENAFLPFNRNGVLFPRKIGGKYAMLSRPSDNGHTPFGDIFYSREPRPGPLGPPPARDGARAVGWQCTKIGAGPMPIETTEGWLLLYHGVLTSCNGFVYSMGAALLDLDAALEGDRPRPATTCSRRRCRTSRSATCPNVVFPCAALSTAHRPDRHLLRRGRHGRVPGARPSSPRSSPSRGAEHDAVVHERELRRPRAGVSAAARTGAPSTRPRTPPSSRSTPTASGSTACSRRSPAPASVRSTCGSRT